jgi:transcriptional regulator with XRE-family HTH domain
MTNVIALRKTKQGYRLPDAVMHDIRMRMYTWNSRDLAEATGVSVACINSIRSNRTKWPRGTTLFAILEALDIDLLLVDAKTGKPL